MFCGESFVLPRKGQWRYCPPGSESGGEFGCKETRRRLRARESSVLRNRLVVCDVCTAAFVPTQNRQKRCGEPCALIARRRLSQRRAREGARCSVPA
jgi:hypothetical protein